VLLTERFVYKLLKTHRDEQLQDATTLMCDTSVKIIQSFTVLHFPALDKQTFRKFERKKCRRIAGVSSPFTLHPQISCLPFYGRTGTDKRQTRMNLEN
jgi:hypothetical protein